MSKTVDQKLAGLSLKYEVGEEVMLPSGIQLSCKSKSFKILSKLGSSGCILSASESDGMQGGPSNTSRAARI